MKVYDEMSEYYDLIYGDQTDLEFYLREAKNARGSVLEVACGTGRILLKLLEVGIDAYGLDFSQKMLDVLKQKAKAKNLDAKILQANMLDFSFDKKFKLIILPYRSFLHLETHDERKKALLNFKKHLEEGGRLILHIYNPSKEDLEMTNEFHCFEAEDLVSADGLKYHVDWHLHYEPSKRLAHYKVVLKLQHNEFIYNMDIYLTPIKEIGELLKECGYKNIRSYCGFDYYPFNGNCKEVLWIAEN
ncbi:class I SAM-dependent methyltransferase [Candidatus Micrarchaeota archaeon]|nr:class I SAM-dependent methyltransferase [Candidatus Micrarchaeota archaeon]